MNIPPSSYAIGCALVWALAAQILNIGLSRLPERNKLPAIYAGLLASLTSGTIALGILVYLTSSPLLWSPALVLAGILTFPIGTGLYYFAGYAFDRRMEFASQFSNFKPVFSILIAFLLLGEELSSNASCSIPIMILGIATLGVGAKRGKFSLLAMALGVLLALSWASGEAFIKIGVGPENSIGATFVALSAGSLVAWLTIGPWLLLNRSKITAFPRFGWAFVLHGMISFCIAYVLLFASIATIGLSRTVTINAFWPALSMILAGTIARAQGKCWSVSSSILLATALLLIGTLLEIGVF